MAFTLTQLQAAVQSKGYGTDTAAAQTDAINAALRDAFLQRRWHFARTAQTATLASAASTATLTPAANPFMVRIAASGLEEEVRYMDPRELLHLRQRFPDASGTPEFWTHALDGTEGKLDFWPAADAAYTVTAYTGAVPTALAAGSDTTTWPDEYIDVIVWGAIKHLAFRQRDFNGLSYAEREYERAMAAAVRRESYVQAQNAPEVGSWDGWEDAERG